MIRALIATVAGVTCLVGGLCLAASLIWSPLAGVATVLILGGSVSAYFGLTYDVPGKE